MGVFKIGIFSAIIEVGGLRILIPEVELQGAKF